MKLTSNNMLGQQPLPSVQTSVDPLHPELEKAAKRLPGVSIKRWMLPVYRPMERSLSPFFIPKPDTRNVKIEHTHLGGRDVIVYSPTDRQPMGLMLYVHGGGLILGTHKNSIARCVPFVNELGLVVVASSYRLAPQHPFPAALNDTYGVWHWLNQNLHQFNLSQNKIAVSGESAGGCIAASLVNRVSEEGGPQPICQVLIYPMLDNDTALRSELDPLKFPLWNNHSNRTGWGSYLGNHHGRSALPRYSVPAKHQNLKALPPTWIGVGSADLFASENRVYAERLTAAGVPCQFEHLDGAFHGFDMVVPRAKPSRTFLSSQMNFLSEYLELETQQSI